MGEIFSIQNILIYLVIINLISFMAMYIDKRKAKRGQRRIKEMTLFTFAFVGGWIGGITGMYTFRHKTKKPMFVVGFPVIAVLHIVLIIVNLF